MTNINMWLAEDLFLWISVACGAFPPVFDPVASKIPYHRKLYLRMEYRSCKKRQKPLGIQSFPIFEGLYNTVENRQKPL